MRVTGVSEVCLEMPDLEVAEQFYTEVLGFPVVERWSGNGPQGAAVWVMAGDRTRIGLWSPQIGLGGGRGGVHVHFAMQVAPEDFDAIVERLRNAGQNVYVHDHGRYGHGRGHAAYITDPGGHAVEFWTWDVATHLKELAAADFPGDS